jgi:dynein heavy chain
MRQELEVLKPKLEAASIETLEKMEGLNVQQMEADITKNQWEEEEVKCSAEAEIALSIKEDCEKQLAKAMPAYNEAIKELESVTRANLVEIKTMAAPPGGVVLTMEALCIMFGIAPQMVPKENGMGKRPEYFEKAKRELLSDIKLLDRIRGFEKDDIDPGIINKITPLTENKNFDPEIIKRSSRAAYGICKWVQAMVIYDKVFKVVKPKRIALAEA